MLLNPERARVKTSGAGEPSLPPNPSWALSIPLSSSFSIMTKNVTLAQIVPWCIDPFTNPTRLHETYTILSSRESERYEGQQSSKKNAYHVQTASLSINKPKNRWIDISILNNSSTQQDEKLNPFTSADVESKFVIAALMDWISRCMYVSRDYFMIGTWTVRAGTWRATRSVDMDILPYDACRVKLSKPICRSDYINASWIYEPGFNASQTVEVRSAPYVPRCWIASQVKLNFTYNSIVFPRDTCVKTDLSCHRDPLEKPDTTSSHCSWILIIKHDLESSSSSQPVKRVIEKSRHPTCLRRWGRVFISQPSHPYQGMVMENDTVECIGKYWTRTPIPIDSLTQPSASRWNTPSWPHHAMPQAQVGPHRKAFIESTPSIWS